MPSKKVHFTYLCIDALNRNYFMLIERMAGSYTMWTTIYFFLFLLCFIYPSWTSKMHRYQWFPFAVGPSRQLVASWAWHGASLRLCIFWMHGQGRKNPGHEASKAIMFGGLRVLAEAYQKRSNLTIGISFVKAPLKPLNPGTPCVPIMEHPSGVQQRRFTSTSVPEILFLV